MKHLILLFSAVLVIFGCSSNNNGTDTVVPSWLTNGLVAYYPFNGNANDESGNGNNGTVNGATLASDRFGNANGTYYFSSSGCSTYISSVINNTTITNALSISFWMFKQGDGCLNSRIWEFCPGPAGTVSSALEAYWYNNNNSAGIDHVMSNGTFVETTISNSLNELQWYNVIYTNDGTQAKIYLNGVLSNVYSTSGNPIIANKLSIGRMGHSAYDAFNGKIDDFRIYNRALSASEVAYLAAH